MLTEPAAARVGSSPAYALLDHTPRSVRLARIAMQNLPAQARGVAQFDDSPLGAFLAALVGYRSRPSLAEALAFVAYVPLMLWALHRADRARPPDERAPARSAA